MKNSLLGWRPSLLDWRPLLLVGWRPSLLGARTLLGLPGLSTSNKKLLGTPGIATNSKDASRLEAIAKRSEKVSLSLFDSSSGGHAVPCGAMCHLYRLRSFNQLQKFNEDHVPFTCNAGNSGCV